MASKPKKPHFSNEKKPIYTIFLLISLSAFNAHAIGAKVGQKIPHTLGSESKITDKGFNYSTLAGDEGLIILFIRSINWCPFCKEQVVQWSKANDKFNLIGYSILAISYDPAEDIKKFSDKEDIAYPMMSDPNSDIIRAFGILNPEPKNSSRYFGIPYPHIYVISKDTGIITHKFAEEHYKDRPEIGMIFEILRTNQKAPTAIPQEPLEN